jgi:hypothetical protein
MGFASWRRFARLAAPPKGTFDRSSNARSIRLVDSVSESWSQPAQRRKQHVLNDPVRAGSVQHVAVFPEGDGELEHVLWQAAPIRLTGPRERKERRDELGETARRAEVDYHAHVVRAVVPPDVRSAGRNRVPLPFL